VATLAHHQGSTTEAPASGSEPEAPDADLVLAARHDLRAFAPLYRRYVTPIYRYCYRNVSDADLASDLTAHIFTRAIEALPTFRSRASRGATGSTFRAWLFTIAHNAVIDHRRRHRPSVPLDDAHQRHAVDDLPGPAVPEVEIWERVMSNTATTAMTPEPAASGLPARRREQANNRINRVVSGGHRLVSVAVAAALVVAIVAAFSQLDRGSAPPTTPEGS
jgi:RNA polymerase sigma factor (sigma-70 family)